MTKPLGEQNYEQFARRYADGAVTKPHNAYLDRPAVLSLLPDLAGKHVLDAGAGPGIYAEIFVARGATVLGFDVTPEMVSIAQERLGTRATFLRADMEEPLTFAQDADFDVVVAPLCLDYVREWGPVFAEFFRVLKPGGVLVFSAGHPFTDWQLGGGNYHEIVYFEIPFKGFGEPYPLIKTYRRPLSAVINPLIAAGFRLDYLLEPQPTEDFRAADPEGYVKARERPNFICVRAIKPAA